MKISRFALPAVACLAFVAAGCGSDDASSSDASTPATDVGADSTPDVTAPDSGAGTTEVAGSVPSDTDAAPTADGPAIVLSTYTPEDAAEGANQPGIRQALDAIIADINDNGGVNGQMIEFDYCNHESNPNKLAQCAEASVSKGATAVVAPYANLPTHYPILDAAKISLIDPVATNPGGLEDPFSYIVSAGAPGLALGLGAAAVDQAGYTNISVVASEIPATVPIGQAFISAVEGHGGTIGTQVNVAPTLTDLSSVVAQAEDADAVFLLLPPSQVLAYIQAANQAGSDTPILGNAGLLQQTHVDQTGGAESPAEGALIANLFPPGDSPVWDDFKAVVADYDGDTDAIDFESSAVQGAWVSMQTFLSVAALIDGEINSESFNEALTRASDVETGGATPTLDLTTPFDVPGFSSIYNRTVYFGSVVDGQFAVADIDPVDTTDDFVAFAAGG